MSPSPLGFCSKQLPDAVAFDRIARALPASFGPTRDLAQFDPVCDRCPMDRDGELGIQTGLVPCDAALTEFEYRLGDRVVDRVGPHLDLMLDESEQIQRRRSDTGAWTPAQANIKRRKNRDGPNRITLARGTFSHAGTKGSTAEPKHQKHSGGELTAVSEQYEAGYAARFRDEAMQVGATTSWQSGWSDANRELGRFDEAFTPAQSALPFFGTGEEARRRGLPFAPNCSEEWKRGWIAADISMGLNEPDLQNAIASANEHEADRRMLIAVAVNDGLVLQLDKSQPCASVL